VGITGIPNRKKEKSKAPTLREIGEEWSSRKFQFENECKNKATANRRSINRRSGIIAVGMQSIVGNTDGDGWATRQKI